MNGPQYEGFSEENLRKLYLEDEGATLQSVAEKLGCHWNTVGTWLRRYGIPTKGKTGNRGPRKPDTQKLGDREWLVTALETKTVKAIAKELGTPIFNVWYWSERHGLAFDETKSEAVKRGLAKKYPEGRRGSEHPRWKGGRTKRGGYILVWTPDHPYATKAGYVMEHRLVMEESLGRILEPSEIVHHRDGNKSNNSPGNLEVTNRSVHVHNHFNALAKLHEAIERIAELETENKQLRNELARYKT